MSLGSGIDLLRPTYKVPLSIPFIAAHLNANKSQAEIAKVAGCSEQAVSQYIQRHFSILEVCCDKSDTILALQCKMSASKANQLLYDVLNSVDYKPAPKDLVSLNIVAGTQTQRYAELTGKTGNTVINIANIVDDLARRKDELLKRLTPSTD